MILAILKNLKTDKPKMGLKMALFRDIYTKRIVSWVDRKCQKFGVKLI